MGNAILDQRGGDSLTATTLDGYSLLADTTVSSATTTVNFTGLNIGWGDELLLVSDVFGSNSSYYLFVNGNTTNTSYYTQYIAAGGTTVSSARENTARFCVNSTASGKTFANAYIKMTNNGFFVFQSNESTPYSNYSAGYLEKWNGTSTFTVSAITSLTITAQISSQIGIGSRFQLYKSGGGASRTWAIT